LLLPFILYLLDLSLRSDSVFMKIHEFTSSVFVKLIIVALAWAYLHHFCAGVRHLFMDLHFGLDKHSARKSAVLVLASSLSLAALVAAKMFGVF
jgi:succinate dehydrogenase / fumarate reductase cytochrome b subunit